MSEILLGEELLGSVSTAWHHAALVGLHGVAQSFELSQGLAHPRDHAFHSFFVHEEGACLYWIKWQWVVHLLVTTEQYREYQVLLVVLYLR